MRSLTTLLFLLAASPALARPADPLPGGALLADDGTALPLLSSDAELRVSGDIVTAEVTQTFRSPGAVAMHARYLFPLPHDAAVYAMTLTIGDEVVRATIQRVEEAKKTFETAKQAGKTAALLEEHRANVFTQDVANIPPGEDVKVEIRYAASVPRLDGRYQLHFPMVVGSRYDNGANGVAVPELSKPLPAGALHQDDPRRGPAGKSSTAPRVSVRAHLITGMPIQSLSSPSHAIEVDRLAKDEREVVLAQGRVIDDRDFVLEYTLGGETTEAAMLLHEDARGAFYSLLLEPPSKITTEEIRARELVFVLDASCSMAGQPLEASKELIRRMLELARPNDRYRVVVFGSTASELHKGALAPTPENLARTRAALERVDDRGGTEIELGLKAALQPKVEGERLRLVLFLTDGYIGNEASVMATIKAEKGDARIFSFGVGDSVNRWLLEEMAIAGNGVARIVGLKDDPAEVVERLSVRLAAPFFTDAWIDWGDLAVTDTVPAGTIDLFAGEPVRLLGRLPKQTRPAKIRATLVGRVGGREARIPLKVRETFDGGGAGAIPILWARAQVAERMRALSRPAARGPGNEQERAHLVEEITQLGLRFALTTQWTAFVAVAERVVEGPAVSAQVPLPQPHGVSPGFSGSSTPEPAEWAAMAMLLCLTAWVLGMRGRLRLAGR